MPRALTRQSRALTRRGPRTGQASPSARPGRLPGATGPGDARGGPARGGPAPASRLRQEPHPRRPMLPAPVMAPGTYPANAAMTQAPFRDTGSAVGSLQASRAVPARCAALPCPWTERAARRGGVTCPGPGWPLYTEGAWGPWRGWPSGSPAGREEPSWHSASRTAVPAKARQTGRHPHPVGGRAVHGPPPPVRCNPLETPLRTVDSACTAGYACTAEPSSKRPGPSSHGQAGKPFRRRSG